MSIKATSDYLHRAEEADRKARECRDPEARRHYEEVARACREMADRAERLGGHAT